MKFEKDELTNHATKTRFHVFERTMRLANLIGGELVIPQTGAYLDCLEPATGSVYAEIPDSGQADVEAAVRAASSAFAGWSRTPADKRSSILVRIADLIDAHSHDLLRAESKDTGSESYDHDGHWNLPLYLFAWKIANIDINNRAHRVDFSAGADISIPLAFDRADDAGLLENHHRYWGIRTIPPRPPAFAFCLGCRPKSPHFI